MKNKMPQFNSEPLNAAVQRLVFQFAVLYVLATTLRFVSDGMRRALDAINAQKGDDDVLDNH
jgi:hypothetical protein